MSGDVTAAIERLRAWSDGLPKLVAGMNHAAEFSDFQHRMAADHRTVLAEVERLRAESERRLVGMQGLRANWHRAGAAAKGYRIERDEARTERDRLRAEREAVAALHFETEGVHTHTVCAHRYCVDDSHDQHQWPCPTAVAAGLSAGSEATS